MVNFRICPLSRFVLEEQNKEAEEERGQYLNKRQLQVAPKKPVIFKKEELQMERDLLETFAVDQRFPVATDLGVLGMHRHPINDRSLWRIGVIIDAALL